MRMINPSPSSKASLNRMKAAKPRNTLPELTLRSKLHRKGLRYRLNKRPLFGFNRTADIVFRSAKVAIFVDGCFWHGCPIHGTNAKANAEFWAEKIKNNKIRDLDTNRRLKEAGWVVVRVWEHENLDEVANTIFKLIKEQRK